MKGLFGNSEGTMHMARDKITHGKRAKRRIKGSDKLGNPDQKEVHLRNILSTNVNQLCIQRRNMNFNNSNGDVTNKGKEVHLKKVIYEKYIRGLKDLRVDKVLMYKDGRTTKMSQHLSQKSELSHVG